ncbi:hypothetical protein CPELA_03915 [Corynebacterium pelargi]|uniref:Uncharacterized protein n=2 Tax=Corynebacterium pelargi TaxID=1471400 RepID=A0A410W7Y2_9CORY|nr:hypothetical protein CPELA_03915 [Corynebacterium pelargi]
MKAVTMQRRPRNSIEQRKADVRKYSKTAAVGVIGGGGIALIGLLAGASSLIVIGLVLAIALGGFGVAKVRSITNYRDPQA